MKELKISEVDLDLSPRSWHSDLQMYRRWYGAVPILIVVFLAAAFLLFYIKSSVDLGNSFTDAAVPGIVVFVAIMGIASYLVKKIGAGQSRELIENLAWCSHWQASALAVPCDVVFREVGRSPTVRITSRTSKTMCFRILSISGNLPLAGSGLGYGETSLDNVAVRLDPVGMFAYFEVGRKRYWCLNHWPGSDLQVAFQKTIISQSYSVDCAAAGSGGGHARA